MKSSKQPARTSSVIHSILGLYGVVGMIISTFGPFKVPFAESHAKEYWRHALAGVVLILLLVGGVISLALYVFEANYFKSQMVDYVKTHYQRDLALEGDIKVTFFPQLSLDAGKMTLSQRNSSKTFASIDNARFYVAWLPLVRKQLQIERVVLDGVHANLIRFKNSSSNIDDLLTAKTNLSEIKFEIDSIKLKNSSLNLHDEISNRLFSLHDVNIETGKLTDSSHSEVSANFRLVSNQPKINTQVKLNSHILFELKTGHYEFSNFEGKAEGEAAGINNLSLNFHGSFNSFPATETLQLDKFSANLKGTLENRKLDAKLDIPKLQGSKNTFTGNTLTFTASLIQDEENLRASFDMPAFTMSSNVMQTENLSAQIDLFQAGRTLQGKLSSPLTLDFTSSQLQLPTIVATLSSTHPLLSSKLTSSVTASLVSNTADKNIQLKLSAQIDDSHITASLAVQDYTHPAYVFDLQANTIDLDRYLAIDWAKRLQDETLPFDLSALQGLNIRGKLRSAAFKIGKLKTSNLLAEIKLEQSVLSIDALNASLYGGTAHGSFSISTLEIPQFTLKQKLSDVQLHSLFSDLAPGEAKLIGKGNLALDLNASGLNMAGLRKTLNGTINLAMGQGSLAGLSLTETLLAEKNQLGIENAVRNENAKFTEKTAFSELKSSLDIRDGNARSNDFLMKSPLFVSKGEGDIVLDSGQFNYRLNTTLSPTLKRSNHGELADIKGITIPMRIHGSAAVPMVSLDLSNASGGNLASLLKGNTAKTPDIAVLKTSVIPAVLDKPKIK